MIGTCEGAHRYPNQLIVKVNFPADAADAADEDRLSALICSICRIGGEIHLEVAIGHFPSWNLALTF
jgi:hypothetical protein